MVMTNGDALTGEIKKLEQGELYFKGDYMLSSMQVDWRQVRELQSLDDFHVVLTNGLRMKSISDWRVEAKTVVKDLM